MLGVEHGVDGGQRDVLVAAAVTGDEVPVEQLVVIAARGRVGHRLRHQVVGVGDRGRHGAVRDVVQELVVDLRSALLAIGVAGFSDTRVPLLSLA